MRCPQCNNKVLQKSDNGETKLRSKGPITFGSDGRCKAQCYWCGTDVVVPVTLTKSLEPRVERFVIPAKVLTPAE